MTTIYRVIADDGTERMATSPRHLTLLSTKDAAKKYRKRPFKGPVVYRLQGFRDWCYSCTSDCSVYCAVKVAAPGHDPGSLEAAVSYLSQDFTGAPTRSTYLRDQLRKRFGVRVSG